MNRWIDASRPRTLPLAASSIITGCAIGWKDSSDPLPVFIAALITCFLLQILSNFANDYGDSEHGTDNAQRVGPLRAVQSGQISKSQMMTAIVILASTSFVSGLLLLYFAFRQVLFSIWPMIFLIAGILAIIAAIRYTAGKNPYGYRGRGDISVFIFFGIVGVVGSNFLITQSWNSNAVMPAIAIGLFSTAVLNLNNMRDHQNDKTSGKITNVVKMGFENSKIYHTCLITLGWLSMIVFLFKYSSHPVQWLVSLPMVAMLIHLSRVRRITSPHLLDPELKKIALSTFATSILVFIFFAIVRF